MAIAIAGQPLSGESVCITAWHSYANLFSASRVTEGVLNEFEVYGDSSGMQVKIMSGEAFIYGHRMYSAAEVILPITAADGANPRIDTVVLRRSLTANTRVLDVINGVAAAIPVATALTETIDIYEFALAYIWVAAAVVTIDAADVTRTGNIGSSGFKPAIRPNVLINGNMDVWQRGISWPAAASLIYPVDRFLYLKSGTMVHAISQNATVPTEAESGIKSNYCLLVDCSTADAAIAAGDFCFLRYAVEGYDYAPLKDNTVTLSFWVKATKTGVYCVGFQNSGSDRSYVSEYIVNVTNTWERKTITLTLDQAGGTENYTNSAGLFIYFTLACGATRQTTPNAWQNGNYMSTANQVNATDNTANDFYLAQVKLELGSGATPFVARPYGEELGLCQRYYEKSFDIVTAPVQNLGSGQGGPQFFSYTNDANQNQLVQYNVNKRASCTIVTYNPYAASAGWSRSGAGDYPATIIGNGTESITIRCTGTPAVAGTMSIHWTASCEL